MAMAEPQVLQVATGRGEAASASKRTLRMLRSIARNRKPLDEIQAQVEKDCTQEGSKYNLFDLTCIGVGTTVGSGCFVLTGQVLPITGPSAMLSWTIAGLVCCLSALAYIDLSARIPTTGSSYIFASHSLGELSSVAAALCLTLEYGVSSAGVARNWSTLFGTLTGTAQYLQIQYPWADGSDGPSSDACIDLGAGAMMLLCVAVCSYGVDLSKVVANSFTVAKVFLLIFFIAAGLAAWRHNVFESREVFFPTGLAGTFKGASALYWGFIGFDEVCCLAGRTEDPVRTMPRALVAVLGTTILISVLSQFALCSMTDLLQATSWPDAFAENGWVWAQIIANVGEVVLIPLIVFLSFLPQPELLGAMGLDGVLPAAFARQDRQGTFKWGCNVSGSIFVVIATFMPFDMIWNLVSLGVLLGFNITQSALIMYRYGNGGRVTQPVVSHLLGLFWVFSAVGSYALWHGVIMPALDGHGGPDLGQPDSDDLCAVLALGGSLLCLVEIWRRGRQEEDSNPDAFLAPMVPFLPGAAICINFMMMSTFSWADHLCTGIFFSCGLAGWVLYRGTNPKAGRLIHEVGKQETGEQAVAQV